MSKSSLVTKNLSIINTPQVFLTGKTSTQQTGSLTTAVSQDSASGFITTVNATLATQGSASFVFNNSYISPGCIFIANLQNYSGTGGSAKVSVNNVTQNQATITVSNSSTTSALGGGLQIGYHIV